MFNNKIEAQPLKIINPAFENIKTAKIVVAEDYGEATSVHLLVYINSEISKLLRLININVNQEKFDMIVKLDIKGKPLWSQYLLSTMNGNHYETYYTGANIIATVNFEINNKTKFTKTYEDKTEPLDRITLDYKKPSKSPNGAPFAETSVLPIYKAFYYCTYLSFGIQYINEALKTNETNRREAAAEILQEIKDPDAILPLIQSINNEADSKSIIKAIFAIKDTIVIEPLISALQNNNYAVRSTVAEALGQYKDQRSVGPLIQALQDDNNRVSEAAAKSLGMIKDPRAVEPLIYSVSKRGNYSAAKALGELKDPRAIEILVKALHEHADNSLIYYNLIDALGEIRDPRAVEPLIDELKKGKSSSIAVALGSIKDTSAVQPLINALDASNSYLREESARALGVIGDHRAVIQLINTLQKDDNNDVREAAKQAIIDINDPRSVELLILALNNNNEKIRKIVVETLGSFGGSRAEESLKTALRDIDPNVGSAALNALVTLKTKDPHGIELLIVDLQNKNLIVRETAKRVLVSMSRKDFGYDYKLWQK